MFQQTTEAQGELTMTFQIGAVLLDFILNALCGFSFFLWAHDGRWDKVAGFAFFLLLCESDRYYRKATQP